MHFSKEEKTGKKDPFFRSFSLSGKEITGTVHYGVTTWSDGTESIGDHPLQIQAKAVEAAKGKSEADLPKKSPQGYGVYIWTDGRQTVGSEEHPALAAWKIAHGKKLSNKENCEHPVSIACP